MKWHAFAAAHAALGDMDRQWREAMLLAREWGDLAARRGRLRGCTT